MNNEQMKLKRAVIKEELVRLTGDYKLAITLNQMIYWSERRNDADKFLSEEQERRAKYATTEEEADSIEHLDSAMAYGWIYKKAEELSEETIINVKPKAMRSYLKTLVENGWLDQRRNPKIAMDRTLQYRVNLLKIQLDLFKLGYALEGYPLPPEIINKIANVKNDSSYFPEDEAREDYWFELVHRMYDGQIKIGKGLIRSACKKRGVDSKILIEYLFTIKPERTASGRIVVHSPFILNNKGNQILLKTFDNYIHLGKGWRMEYTYHKEEIALEIVDRMIQEKRHFSPEGRAE